MSLFSLLFCKEQLCHVYGEVQSIINNPECDALTARERSGRAPTTGGVNLIVLTTAAFIRTAHEVVVHLILVLWSRTRSAKTLTSVSAPLILPQPLNWGYDWKSLVVGPLTRCSGGLNLLNDTFCQGFHTECTWVTLYKHRWCLSLDLITHKNRSGSFSLRNQMTHKPQQVAAKSFICSA